MEGVKSSSMKYMQTFWILYMFLDAFEAVLEQDMIKGTSLRYTLLHQAS